MEAETLPQGWLSATLDDVAKWGSGGTPSRKSPEFFNGSIPWFKTGELGSKTIVSAEEHITEEAIEKSSAKIFPRGSIGIAMYGATIGKLSIWGIDASTNQACAVAQPYDSVLSNEFLYYFLRSEKRNLINSGKGGAQPNISQGILKEWPIWLPPFNEQIRIVAKIEELLSELDKGIESLKTAREQLKVYRQAVLKHAFDGKLTAQWREENKDELNPSTSVSAKDHRCEISPPDSLSIPDGWYWSSVGDLLLEGPANGRSVKDRVDGFPVLRLTALKDGRIDLAEYKHGNWNREAALKFIVQSGDFLLSRGNGSKHLVGRGGVVPVHQDEIAFPDTMVRLRIDSQTMHIDFLSRLWESRLVRSQIESAARTTAGIYKINQDHIKGFRVPVPGLDEQEVIVGLLEEKLSIVEELERDLGIRLAASEALRQSILKKAFSGQLVEQDPSDEPASVLLERIRTEKARHKPKPNKKEARRKVATG